MSDLNILHAQNADLKSRVSDSGLACDSPASAPDRKDIDAFRLAMREGEARFSTPFSAEDNRFEPNRREKEGKDFSDTLDAHAIHPDEREQARADTTTLSQLSSLFSMASTFSDVEAPARVEAPHAILSEEDLNMLVERILVSAADNGTQEVRLILNERVLTGTEIILSRDLSGQLVVALHCADASTFQTLVASQFDLKQMLETREIAPVQVSVDIHHEGNDSQQRSRGYVDYEPDQLRKRDNA